MACAKKKNKKGARNTSSQRKKRVQSLHMPEVQTLHPPEHVIRRFVLNQPSSRYGVKPGWYRDTVSFEEYEAIRAHFVLWTRGRVYFENLDDLLPRCKSPDGIGPSPDVVDPVNPRCGDWDERGLFVPQCRLAFWHTEDGERRSPVCRETWNLLGVASADGLPFWISLKGAALKPTRQFLSMCYARIRMQGVQLFQCAITLTSTLVENQYGQFHLPQFRQPEWVGPDDHQYTALAEMAAILADDRVERTFEYESQLALGPGPTAA
ncbi:MAG: hypothetical protein JSU86_00125 [Phycisphaerales bacterium]|nr:MAG: hypothetical protein JSU86_00125 [Phycisphaerales bacterium]